MNNLMNRQWWAAAGTRCIKTGAQAALGTIGASAAVIGQVNWEVVAGAAALAAVVSLLTSLEGLPEVDTAATADAATTTAPVVVTESTTAVTSPTSAVTSPTTTSTDAASVPAATAGTATAATTTTTDKEA